MAWRILESGWPGLSRKMKSKESWGESRDRRCSFFLQWRIITCADLLVNFFLINLTQLATSLKAFRKMSKDFRSEFRRSSKEWLNYISVYSYPSKPQKYLTRIKQIKRSYHENKRIEIPSLGCLHSTSLPNIKTWYQKLKRVLGNGFWIVKNSSSGLLEIKVCCCAQVNVSVLRSSNLCAMTLKIQAGVGKTILAYVFKTRPCP